jgi:hypothetical protein
MTPIELLGLIGATTLPLWNIPLIYRIRKRRSSADISLPWVVGVWVCLLAMLPSGLISADRIYRVFSVLNVGFFTVVLVQVLRFRGGKGRP